MPSVVVDGLTLLLRIQKVSNSNLGSDDKLAMLIEVFLGIPQYLQADSVIIP
jgi:hypothetical protein